MPVDGDIILKAGLDATGVSKRIDELQKSITKGLKNIIRIGFGVRSVFALIRKLRSSLVGGLGDLAQVHEPLNQAMSSIMTSLRLLRNTFASAFAPIIETVAPILTTFINKIADAVSAIGQFIAALTGKEYVRAGVVYQDYAASLDKSTASSKKSTSATKKQTEAQKKLNREITHFDDLVILHDKDKDDNDTNSPVSNPVSGFSTMPIGQAVSKFATDFKAAWANADFTDIGRIVGEKLKNALDNIPWSKIQDTLSRVGKSVATFLNGFLETPGLFDTIGRTIANGINSAVLLANSFVRNFHWNSLGRAVSTTIISALNNINWPLVFDTVRGFASGLATYLNNLFTPQTFIAVGQTIGKLLNAALEFINTFGDTFNFTEFGSSLAAGFNRFLKTFNIARLTTGVNTLVTGLRDAIVSFLSHVDWQDFGYKLRNIILGIKWKQILLAVGEIIWKAINSAIEILKGLFDVDNISTPFTDALSDLSDTVQEAANNIDFESLSSGFTSLATALTPMAEGFGAGLVNVLNTFINAGTELLNLIGPAMQALADALNDMDPDLLEKIGEALGVIAGAFVTMSIIGTIVGAISKFIAIIGGLSGPIATAIGMAGSTTVGGAIGTGLLGFASGFMTVSGAAFAAYFAIKYFTENIATTEEELNSIQPQFQTTKTVISQVGEEFGLTGEQISELAWLLYDLDENTDDINGTYALFNEKLEDAGINVDDFKSALSNAAQVASNSGQDIEALRGYIDNVSTSSATAETDTSEFAGAFDAFKGLSITTPLKLALISGAVAALGSSGEVSDEKIGNLYSALDAYKADPTEAQLSRLQTAFEDSGISAEEFSQSISTAFSELDPATQMEIAKAAQTIQSAGPDLEKTAQKTFKNIPSGGKKGIEDNAKDVISAGGDMVGDMFDTMDTEADSHSPSRRAEKLGGNIAVGLNRGMTLNKPLLLTTAGSIISGIMTKIQSFTGAFTTIGERLISSLANGVGNSSSSVSNAVGNIMANMRTKLNSLNFWEVGNNIGNGIYNGLIANNSRLQTLAWNTAVDMYNSACSALGIASPSKKFAWIGDMITQGLSTGILDNESNAVDAVTDVTSAMTDEAEKANPAVSISTSIDGWIESLDSVLTKFSDTIITRFDGMINTLAQLSNVSSLVPAVAQGRVIPASLQPANSSNDNSANMMRMLENLTSNQMTPDDLRPLLIEMFTTYMNLSWTIGDEQLARHANNGNLILNRRYSTIKV